MNAAICPECGEGEVQINITASHQTTPIGGNHDISYIVNKDEFDTLANWGCMAFCYNCSWLALSVEVEME